LAISEFESSWEEAVRKMRKQAKSEPEYGKVAEEFFAIGNEQMSKVVKSKETEVQEINAFQNSWFTYLAFTTLLL